MIKKLGKNRFQLAENVLKKTINSIQIPSDTIPFTFSLGHGSRFSAVAAVNIIQIESILSS